MLPKNRPTHPGEFIREDILKELSVTEKELAKVIGVSSESVSGIINKEERISVDMALRLVRGLRDQALNRRLPLIKGIAEIDILVYR